MEEAKNGTKEIVTPSGFTKEAAEYAENYRPELRLKHKDKIIKLSGRLKKRKKKN